MRLRVGGKPEVKTRGGRRTWRHSSPLLYVRREPGGLPQHRHGRREAYVLQRPAHDRVRLGNAVKRAKRHRIAVWGFLEHGYKRRDGAQLCARHEVRASDVRDGAVRKEGCRVEEREEPAARGPGELVPEGVVRAVGCPTARLMCARLAARR
jgi:hypothetical protein